MTATTARNHCIRLATALATPALLVAQPVCAADLTAHRGALALGAQVEVGLGAVAPTAAGGTAVGFAPHIGLAVLRDGWAIPVTFRLERGITADKPSFAQVGVGLGAEWRHRLSADSACDLALGGGARIGGFVASRKLEGLPASNLANDKSRYGFPLAPFASARLEWWPSEAVAIKGGLEYAAVYFPSGLLHLPELSIAVALTL